MLSPAAISPTSISYHLITKRDNYSYADYLLGPDSLNNNSLRQFMRTAPMDLLQVINPDLYYQMQINRMMPGKLNFGVQYVDNFQRHLYLLDNPRCTVYLVHGLCTTEVNQVLSRINQTPCRYCLMIGYGALVNFEQAYPNIQFVQDAVALYDLLLKDMERLAGLLALAIPKAAAAIVHYMKQFRAYPKTIAEKRDIPLFKPTHNNYYTWSLITGNYWFFRGEIDPSTPEQLKNLEITAGATREGDSQARFQQILASVSLVDEQWLIDNKLKAVGWFEPTINPLIVCLPFQNPQSEKLATLLNSPFPEQFMSYLQLEQNFNYVIKRQPSEGTAAFAEQMIPAVAEEILEPRLTYLDFIAYLHASFSFSPVYRFPLTGGSLNNELAFLKPDTRNNLHAHNLNKTIAPLSKRLQEKFMTQKLQRYLKSRNGQIVAITDLPVEVMNVDGLPLMYTHDVCRLPETNYKVAMSVYTLQNQFNYTVPDDLIKKTLVILGAPNDPNFKNSNTKVTDYCMQEGIPCEPCDSIMEFRALVEKFRPEFLIVDCHGGFDPDELSSYLEINGQKLKHTDIQQIQHVTPLVFLSACNTSPTYGYVHSIGNAFLSRGTMSVTTTLLPINIDRGTAFYLRLLRLLATTAHRGEFPNWLAFLAHVTRTAPFNDVYGRVTQQVDRLSKNKKERTLKVMKELQRIVNGAVAFSTRRETFTKIHQLLNNMDEQVRVNFHQIVHEHLLYSHLGRSDLVYFESWQKRKQQQVEEFAVPSVSTQNNTSREGSEK